MAAQRVLSIAAAALVLGAAACLAAITQDEVTSLPGWDGELPSKHYSGLIPVGGNKPTGYLHYWFIECEKNPASAPVALWLNGGPGSSSLIGLLTENGQLQTNDDSINGSDISLVYNPYSWSQVANVLYLEQPKGVGFSYCTEGTPCTNTDESVGEEAVDFLEAFFEGFSEYKQNDFFITGESYAGIYIPEIISVLDKRGSIPNFKGAAIGDGCWGNAVGTCGFANEADRISTEFYHGHGMFPQPIYDQVKEECGNFSHMSVKCNQLMAQINRDIGNFDIYQIYDQCANDQVTARDIQKRLHEAVTVETEGFQSFRVHPQLHSGVSGALNDYVCGGMTVMDQWLAQDSVQKALHVNRTGHQAYDRTAKDLRPLYKELAQKYRLVIYSGDVDACVPFVGSEEWTRELGFPVKEDWRPWKAGTLDKPSATSSKAGYVTTYDAGNQTFTFLTVNGAGHLVPQHRPVQALAMISRFFNDEKF